MEIIIAMMSKEWRQAPLHTAGGYNWCSLLEEQFSLMHQAFRMLHCLGPNSIIGIFPKEVRSQIHKDITVKIFFFRAVYNYAMLKEAKCPTIIDSLNKLLDICSVEFYVVIG